MYQEKDDRFEVVFQLANSALLAATGKHLSNAEYLVLEGTLKGQNYLKIASDHGYASEYFKNDIGPKLWKRLSEAFGEKISKANVKIVLQQRSCQESNISRIVREMNNVDFSESTSNFRFRLSSSSSSSHSFRKICHNLPNVGGKLFGRSSEISQLTKWLNSIDSNPQISIEGVGGIGKTHLVLNFAYQCLKKTQSNLEENESFARKEFLAQNIIFVTAQSKYCTSSHGLIPCLRSEKSLDSLLHSILKTLRVKENFKGSSNEKIIQYIYNSFVGIQTLLIIDSFDKMVKKKEVLGFLYSLPSTVKVIITSRECSRFPSINIDPLSKTIANSLVKYELDKNKINLSQEDILDLMNFFDGHPAGLIYAINCLGVGYDISYLLSVISQEKDEFYQFYVNPLLDFSIERVSSRLLIVLTFSPNPMSRELLSHVLSEDNIEDTINQLKGFSFVRCVNGFYSLNAISRMCAMNQSRINPSIELELRHRWVSYYADLFWVEGPQNSEGLISRENTFPRQEWDNLIEVLEWCIDCGYHSKVQKILRIMKCNSFMQNEDESL